MGMTTARNAHEPGSRPPLLFGLRIALWYATLFVTGSLAIVLLTYYLTAASLAQRDQQIIRGKLGEYAAAYARGGEVVGEQDDRERAAGCARAALRPHPRGRARDARPQHAGRVGSVEDRNRVG